MEKDDRFFCCNCTFFNPNNNLCKRRDMLKLESDWCFEFCEKIEVEEKGENTMDLNYKNFDEAYKDFVAKKYGTNDLQEIIKITNEIRRAAEERIDDAKRDEFDDLKMNIYDMLMEMAKIKPFIKALDADGNYVVLDIDDIAEAIDELEY